MSSDWDENYKARLLRKAEIEAWHAEQQRLHDGHSVEPLVPIQSLEPIEPPIEHLAPVEPIEPLPAALPITEPEDDGESVGAEIIDKGITGTAISDDDNPVDPVEDDKPVKKSGAKKSAAPAADKD